MNANELADADDVIHKLQSWSEAYPTDIFPEISQEDIEYINAVNPHLSGRFFAHVGRHFIKKGFDPAIAMLRQQQAEIEALKAKPVMCVGYWDSKTGAFHKELTEHQQKRVNDGFLKPVYTVGMLRKAQQP